jgi:Na+-driven multidrug efflux pump
MNKILPIIMVVLFWGLYYLGITHEGLGNTIAIVITLLLLLYVLYCTKNWLKKRINNINN